MLKGATPGPKRRILTLRKSLRIHSSRAHLEEISLKFIDTSGKGHSTWQTRQEKDAFLGQRKIKSA